MINRITSARAPGNGRRQALPAPSPIRSSDDAAWKELGERIEQFIGNHPVLSLAVGFSVGIVLGCLIKRR